VGAVRDRRRSAVAEPPASPGAVISGDLAVEVIAPRAADGAFGHRLQPVVASARRGTSRDRGSLAWNG
jgi:hypothetical protein